MLPGFSQSGAKDGVQLRDENAPGLQSPQIVNERPAVPGITGDPSGQICPSGLRAGHATAG
ncbi:MAG: hypothetical protein WCZ43_09575 [Proteiniphilum sp.]